jgi:hypothetical protein
MMSEDRGNVVGDAIEHILLDADAAERGIGSQNIFEGGLRSNSRNSSAPISTASPACCDDQIAAELNGQEGRAIDYKLMIIMSSQDSRKRSAPNRAALSCADDQHRLT